MSGNGDAAVRLSERGPLAAGEVRFLMNSVAPEVDARASAGAPHGRISPGALHFDPARGVRLAEPAASGEADGYAAPEVAAGSAPTARSEVFSLATTAYSLLTGHPPNPHGFATVRRSRPDLSPQVDGALLQATARSPELRFGSAAEFAVALSDALSDGRLPIPQVSALSPGQAPPPGRTSSPAHASGPLQSWPGHPPAERPATVLPAPMAGAPAPRAYRNPLIPDAALPFIFLALVVVAAAACIALFLA